jgi:hypothetical protein
MQHMGRRLGAIALLAMLVRAIVPAGYMLATAETAHGRYLTITICDSHAGATQVLDLTTGKLVDPSAGEAPGQGRACALRVRHSRSDGAAGRQHRAGDVRHGSIHRAGAPARCPPGRRHRRAAAAIYRTACFDLSD